MWTVLYVGVKQTLKQAYKNSKYYYLPQIRENASVERKKEQNYIIYENYTRFARWTSVFFLLFFLSCSLSVCGWKTSIIHQIFEAEVKIKVQPLCVTNNVGHRPSYATLIYILWEVLHPGKTIGNV